jgi:hypothetical protein
MSHLLQYVSSVFGLVILAFWFRGLLARTPRPNQGEPLRPAIRWLILILIGAAALVIGGLQAMRYWEFATYYHMVYLLLTRTIAWFVALYFVVGAAVFARRKLVSDPAI